MKLNQPARARAEAFSLVELLCAIMVLGIGITGITMGISTALTSNKETERQTAAALLAAGRIETLRAEGYLVEGEEEGTGDEELSAYAWIQRVKPTEVDGLYEVAVEVAWAADGTTLYELTTLLFDPPVYSTLDDTEEQENRQKARE